MLNVINSRVDDSKSSRNLCICMRYVCDWCGEHRHDDNATEHNVLRSELDHIRAFSAFLHSKIAVGAIKTIEIYTTILV